MIRTLSIALLLIAAGAQPASAAAQAKAPAAWSGKVTRVTDGDTLWVRPPQGGAPRAVRLDGIDAPELCQRHGKDARKALEQRALNRTVRVAARGKDDYRRSLARVSLGGDDLGRWMVAQGHAWAHRWRGKTTAYSQQEARARLAKRGLFADAQPELPRDFRKRHGACR